MAVLNLTEEEKKNISLQLKLLSDERAIELLPAIIYLVILIVIGLIGNSLVVYIFSKKFKRTTQTTLFVALACFDLVSCGVAMPFEILDLRFFFNFSPEIVCKILRSLVTFTICASNQILLLIAIDRYRKVCCPLKMQMTVSITRKLIIVAVIIAILMTIPAFFLYGIRSAVTPIPGLVGSDCATGDDVSDTIYPVLYEFVLIFFFVFFTLCFVVLYSLIWKASRRLAFARKSFIKTDRSVCSDDMTSSTMIGEGADKHKSNDNIVKKSAKTNSRSNVYLMKTNSFHKQISSEPSSPMLGRKQVKISPASIKTKATVIAFLVTLVFFLSFIPHLITAAFKNIYQDFDYGLRGAQLVAFNIFLRFYFVNCVANPFIYSAMNPRFRMESHNILKRILCCLCCQRTKKKRPEML